jgi:subtilisin-like proprotein convertase family protein
MHPDLAAKYPEIQAYVGQGIEDPSVSIRFSTTIFGLHVMYFTGHGVSYMDTYTKDLKNYIVYEKAALPISSRSHDCLVTDELTHADTDRISSLRLANDGQFRTYRLALACTIEYAAYHITAAGVGSGTLEQKKAAVLAAMNVSMVRVNGVYEKDMSLHMQLIANNDALIFVTSDSFSNDNANQLINQSQTVIDATVGSAAYDIGHTVSTGGGGLAQSPAVCINGQKARGITGSPAPVGDAYDIDFVAHEMGHQFGASHTFSGTTGNCAGNIEQAYAVEPGSGTTIMAYAGICAPQDVQPHSDAYFHAVSIGQMMTHVTGTGSCSVNVANGNNAPVANAGTDYTIPNGTAFLLKGSGTDANGDVLTYCWEQTTSSIGTQPPVSTSTGGPNFRSFTPTISPNRYIPEFQSVLAGNLAPTWEVVPTVARAMNFALTARDNKMVNGGQTGRDDMTVNFAAVGPFKITAPAVENVSWTQGTTQTITWDVAGTTANGINTANVNILLSTDAGVTFSTVLAANTVNDGTETITVPNIAAPYCRIMIEAVGNIFYAVSKSFAIGYTVNVVNTCNTYTGTVVTSAITGVNPPSFYAMGTATVPATDNGVISDMNLSINITHPKINDLYIGIVKPGSAAVDRIVYQQGCNAFISNNMITTFDDSGVTLACGGIANNNVYKPVNTLDFFNGLNSQGGWRLAIADVTVPNSGTLNSWSLNICTTTTTVTLGTQSYGLTDFTLYPNPNNGNFTVGFNSNSTNDIKIAVHDMRGREVFKNSYSNSGLFSQNLQLDKLQAGVYLVTVQDGDKKEVKRIVIE